MMLEKEADMRYIAWAVAFVVLVYIGTYLAVVERWHQEYPDGISWGRKYSVSWGRSVFDLAHQIDRRLRPGYWSLEGIMQNAWFPVVSASPPPQKLVVMRPEQV